LPDDFAAAIRSRREARGLSQSELARLCGLTPSYISLLESRKKPPPSDEVVDKLAAALDVDRRVLLDLAHIERTPSDVRRKLRRLEGGLKRQNRLNRKLLDEVVPVSLYNFTRPAGYLEAAMETLGLVPGKSGALGKLVARIRGARSFRDFHGQAKDLLAKLSDEEWDELAKMMAALKPLPAVDPGACVLPVFDTVPPVPARGQDLAPRERVAVLPATYGEDRYYYRVGDDTMYPRCEPGDLLLADESVAPRNGDLVLARIEGEGLAAKFLDLGREVEFAPANPQVPPRRFPKGRKGAPYQVAATCLALRRSLS